LLLYLLLLLLLLLLLQVTLPSDPTACISVICADRVTAKGFNAVAAVQAADGAAVCC
jgi:hypothetical protein